jgi:hypothetical protein
VGDEFETTEFSLWPLLVHRHATILYGQEGTAKSYLALLLGYLAVSGSSEVEALGLRVEIPLHSLLYLDWEGDVNVLRERLDKLSRGMSLPVVPFQYRKCKGALITEMDSIKISLKEQPDLLIVDSLIPAAGGDVTITQPANDFFEALKSFDCTTLIVGHPSKGSANTATASVFGSAVFQQRARSTWEVRKDQEEEEDTILVGVVHKKMNYGRREAPIGFRFSFMPDRVLVTREDVAHLPSMENARQVTTRIVRFLTENGAQSPTQIKEGLGLELNQVTSNLTYLRGKNRVVRVQRGLWGVLLDEGKAKGEPWAGNA